MGVILESREQIVRVRLNRPEKLNALTRTMLDKLDEVFAGIEGERAVILTGEGERPSARART